MPRAHSPHIRRGRSRLLGTLALALAGGLVLSACSARKQYGVATTVVPGKGNCDTARNVEVGAALDLSGPQAELGREYLAGIQMAIAQVDHSRGILKNHSCLELLYKDTQGNPPVADKAVLDLANNEVVSFLVGPFTGAEVQFSGADLGLSGVPTTSMSSLDSTAGTKAYPQLFPVVPIELTTATEAVSYARSKHWTQVAVIGEDNAAGHEGVSDFAGTAQKAGLTLTGKASGPNYQAELQRLQAGSPQGLFVAGDDLGIKAILQARQALGWSVPVIAGEVAADAGVVSAVGPGGTADVSVVVPAPLVVTGPGGTPSDPTVASFLGTLRQRLGPDAPTASPIPYAAAYDGVELMAYVANSINSIQAGNVRTFIENANYQGLLASYGYTSGRHEGVNTAQLKVVPLSSLSGGVFHV